MVAHAGSTRRGASPTPVEVVRAERFRLLDEVRQHLARSERAQALPPAVLGAWLAVGVFLAQSSHQRLVLLAAPLALVGAAWISARRWPLAEISPSARWTSLALVGLVGASLLREVQRAGWYVPALTRGTATVAVAVGLGVVAFAVYRLAQRGPELAPVIIAMITAREVIRDRIDPDLWFWGALGAFLLALGAFRLVRLRVYRRRLQRLLRELGVERAEPPLTR